MTESLTRTKVVYLLGAGASHACVEYENSAYGILMGDIALLLVEALHQLVEDKYQGTDPLRTLVNDVVDADTDFEHLITFLDQSPSGLHQAFAGDLRSVFERVLRDRLEAIRAEQEGTPDELYYALLDMHLLEGLGEELGGFLTLNYDDYLEHAIERSSEHTLDAGVGPRPSEATGLTKVLKLHGSFGWSDTWPVGRGDPQGTLWIPPGIQKHKDRYPFNLLWGLARELLDCDILRIVGCQLSANDWDLISLLFTTRHTNASKGPYRVELIDAPENARRLQHEYPYLDVRSILEIEPMGSNLISEFTGWPIQPFRELSSEKQDRAIESAGTGRNWFWIWLKQKAEAAHQELESLETPLGAFQRLLEAF